MRAREGLTADGLTHSADDDAPDIVDPTERGELLTEEQLDRSVLAITFTNKATEEMKSRIISALITSRNRPKVSSVSGRVSTISSGLTTALAKPSRSAETINADVLSNRTPLKM